MNTFYVYLLLDPRKDNEPFYVGKGKNKRYKQHLFPYDKKCGNKLKRSVIDKIRAENLEPVVEFVQTNLLENVAFDLEKALIAKYGRRDLGLGPLTNLTDGGEGAGGHIFSKERCEKISKSLTGKKATPAQRLAQSIAATNRIRPPMSEATKEKIRQKAIGRGHTEETRKKLSVVKTGISLGPPSEETKQKISKSNKGKPGLRGRIVSEETREKIRQALTGNVYGPLSDEHRHKVSEALKGKKKKPFSEEHRKNIGNATRGRILSEQARLNMSLAQKNRRKNEAA